MTDATEITLRFERGDPDPAALRRALERGGVDTSQVAIKREADE